MSVRKGGKKPKKMVVRKVSFYSLTKNHGMAIKVAEIWKKYLYKKMKSTCSKTDRYRKKYETIHNLPFFFFLNKP
jgi:hypothetical protein